MVLIKDKKHSSKMACPCMMKIYESTYIEFITYYYWSIDVEVKKKKKKPQERIYL
jgi:hypothetical protein